MEIKGTIKLQDDWQPVVYLASLNSPENLFVASPEFVIAQTFIQPDGSFQLKTETISKQLMFYRLYLVRGDNSAVEFNDAEHKNYQHLLIQRNSFIEIEAKIENNTLVITKLDGGEENNAILDFDQHFHELQQLLSGDVTKAKNNLLIHQREVYIREFVNTSQNALLGLYALYHIEGKDTDFLKNSEFYFDFKQRLDKQYPGTAYAQSYSDLLNQLIGFREFVCEMPGVRPKWKDQLIIAEGVLILLLLLVIMRLVVSKNKQKTMGVVVKDNKSLFESLTTKQQEILRLLAEGKTNKEIALELFVELSTVKTHINNIYRQLGVTTRKEASAYFHKIKY